MNSLIVTAPWMAVVNPRHYTVKNVIANSSISGFSRQSDGSEIAPSNKYDPQIQKDWIEIQPRTMVISSPALRSAEQDPACQYDRESNGLRRNLVRRAIPRHTPVEIVASAPVGMWEGEVLEVDSRARTFNSRLSPLRGSSTEMSGEISFDQINDEDKSLIQPGAVFYIEQYRIVVKKQVSYDQRVRFRRLAAWTAKQIERVAEMADALGDIPMAPSV